MQTFPSAVRHICRLVRSGAIWLVLLQVAGTAACRVTVHEYTQLRAELTAVVLAASTPLVVVGQVVLTLRGPHELLHVAARHEHDGVVEQVVRGEPSSKGKTPHKHQHGTL